MRTIQLTLLLLFILLASLAAFARQVEVLQPASTVEHLQSTYNDYQTTVQGSTLQGGTLQQ